MCSARKYLLTCMLMAVLLFSGVVVFKSDAANNGQAPRITIEEVTILLAEGKGTIFIDTRNSGQWAKAKDKIPKAMRLTNNQELSEFVGKYPPDTVIVTYCT